MGFKIEQQAQAEPVYCDYIQEKIDIAKQNGAVYELVDEDYRIQALYDQENLVTRDKIKVINRIRSSDNGKEFIVVNKNVDFFNPDPSDPKEAGVFNDRYSTREGIVELPLKSRNVETGETEVKQNRLVYTIPFSGSKVDEYLAKAEDEGIIPQLTFYEGATSSNRLPTHLPTVANPEYFKEASWTELLIGKEKKVLNSLLNRLPEVRNELKDKNSPKLSGKEEPVKVQGQPIAEPKGEVIKEQETKENNVEPKSFQQQHNQSRPSSGSGSGSGSQGGNKKN